MATTIDVNEAQQQLPELLELAKAGNEIIIAEGSTPVARLIATAPAATPTQPRVADLHQGAARVSDDFDQPLLDEFWMGSS